MLAASFKFSHATEDGAKKIGASRFDALKLPRRAAVASEQGRAAMSPPRASVQQEQRYAIGSEFKRHSSGLPAGGEATNCSTSSRHCTASESSSGHSRPERKPVPPPRRHAQAVQPGLWEAGQKRSYDPRSQSPEQGVRMRPGRRMQAPC